MRRLQLAWRWFTHPWRDLSLALALVGAAVVPAAMSSAADLWERATADQTVTALTGDRTATELGVRIRVDAILDHEHLEVARTAVERRIGEVPRLGAVRSAIFTYSGALQSAGDPPGVPVRLLAADGAVEALDVVDRGASGDVWISTWLAERAGVAPGDQVSFVADEDPNTPGADIVGAQGSSATFTVAGTYRPLWTETNTNPAGYWAAAPPGLLPRFIGPFAEPAFELLVTDEASLASSALPGAVEWQAPMEATPDTLTTLEAMGSAYRSLETDLSRGEIGSLLTAAVDGASTRLQFDSSLPATLSEARKAAALLVQPIGATRSVGVLLGVIVMATGGWLIVERRRSEFELLAGDGERWLRLGARTGWQLVAPAIVGSALGVAIGLAAVRVFGVASSPSPEGIRPEGLLWTGAALAVASIVAGVRGQATIEVGPVPTGRLPFVAVGASILAIFLWAQLQRTTASGTVDVTVIAFPLVVFLAAGATSIAAVRAVMKRFTNVYRALPPAPALAWRRIAGASGSGQALIVALALGGGLALLSGQLVRTLDRSIEAKLATEIGGVTKLDVFGPDPGGLIPAPHATIIRTQDTRLTPGQMPVRVVAVDPASIASAITWPDAFGEPLSDVLQLLAGGGDDAVPAMIVSGASLPAEGAFGTFQPVPYRLVGSIASAPLASAVAPTLLVSSPRMDQVARARLEAALGSGDQSAFQPPSARFRRHVVSTEPPSSLIPALAASGLQVRTVETRNGRLLEPDILVPRAAFSFLRLFGWVAATAAAAGLLLYLSARRPERRLQVILLRRMGVRAGVVSLIPAMEIGLLIAVAALPSLAVVGPMAAGLADRFEPSPGLPPKVDSPPLPAAAWIGLGLSIAAVGVAVWLGEWRWARRASAVGMTDV